MEFDQELDTRGMFCPIPILKTKVAIDRLRPGQVLKVISTDPGSVRDMQAFARQTRNPLLISEVDDREFIFFLRKDGTDGAIA